MTTTNTEEKKFDVVAVSIETGKVMSLLGEGKTEKNAEAIVTMAVMRRGVDTEFYAPVRAGRYAEGDKYEGET